MEKYTIKISLSASDDLKQIAVYMRNVLKVPNTARNYLKLLRQEIDKLAILPKRHEVIEKETINQFDVRKLVVKNYIIFYIVDDEEKTVNVERILYGASDWMNEL